MICVCGYDLGEPEHGKNWQSWEECPNCERKADSIEGAKRLRAERQTLLRVARAANAVFDAGQLTDTPEADELDNALKEVERLLGVPSDQ